MRRRLIATALLLTTAAAVACGRSGADFLDDGTTTVPTGTASPTGSGTSTPEVTPVLVISEVFVRDPDTTASNANLSSVSFGESGGDDRFIELVNLSIGALDLLGIRIAYDGNGDGIYGDFHVFAAATLAPGKAAVVFNERSGVNLSAVRDDAGPDTVVVESNGGFDFGNEMAIGDTPLAIRVYAASGALLYHWDGAHQSSGGNEKVVLRAGTTSAGLASFDVGTEPETCGGTTCDGVYSIAVEDPIGVGTRVWADHRDIGVPAGTACSTAQPDSCCRFSPGRFVSGGACRQF